MDKITINYKGIDFDVEFYYQPYEKQTRDYPGMPEAVEEIYSMEHQGTDFYELLEDQFEDIEKCILDKIKELREQII